MDLTPEDYEIIRRVARRHRRCPADRDDLVQEAALRLWQEEYDPTKLARASFVTSRARWAMLDYLSAASQLQLRRQEQHRTLFISQDAPGMEPATHDDIDAIDARLDVRRALRRVPKRARRLLAMRYLLGMEVAEIERKTGIGSGTFWYYMQDPATHRVVTCVRKWPDTLKSTGRTPEKLRALAGDMPAFLASLPPVTRQDTTAWLAGSSIEEIACAARVTRAAVYARICIAFQRAMHRSRESPQG